MLVKALAIVGYIAPVHTGANGNWIIKLMIARALARAVKIQTTIHEKTTLRWSFAINRGLFTMLLTIVYQ